MHSNLKKILILRLSALGDTIHTLPLAASIKKTYPECQIGWVVEDKASLFIENNPLVDKCYVIPKKLWKKQGKSFFQKIQELKTIINVINEENYDVVLDTQQLFKSALLLPFLNIKRKITLSGGREFSALFSNEIVQASHKLFDPNYHVVKRNLELAAYLGADTRNPVFVLPEPKDSTIKTVNTLLADIDKNKPTVVLSPATTWENKHWVEENWSQLVNYLKEFTNVVFTGMACDLPLIERIIQGCSYEQPIVLAGKTNLEELAQVYRMVDVVISPDSGSAHIAWAVMKPAVITLFFATAENRNAPFGSNCYVLAPDLDCHPCMKRKCKLSAEKNRCCSGVTPKAVINILQKILHLDEKRSIITE